MSFGYGSQPMAEAYADDLLDGVDTQLHEGSADLRGRLPIHLNAWLIVVLALVALWFVGGVVFKGVNI